MSDEVLIKVEHVDKVFNLGKSVVHALKDINLEIFRGEYLSIMGPSGSGKSTLFNMIGALDRPSAGKVEVAGVNLTKLTARQLAHPPTSRRAQVPRAEAVANLIRDFVRHRNAPSSIWLQ